MGFLGIIQMFRDYYSAVFSIYANICMRNTHACDRADYEILDLIVGHTML